jgi:hypothetical protein
MTAAQGRPGRAEPVERFRPTSGRLVGFGSVAVIAALLVYLALEVRSLTGLRLGAGLVFFGVLTWVTQLRPRATAYPDELHLQNSLRDVTVPLSQVDEVRVGRMLNVWVGERRFVCIGIGAPLRTMVRGKSRGPSSLLGWDRLEAYTEESTPLRPDQSAMTYADFVETRITELVEDARRRSTLEAATMGARPTETWAWPEITALALTATAFGATLLL